MCIYILIFGEHFTQRQKKIFRWQDESNTHFSIQEITESPI